MFAPLSPTSSRRLDRIHASKSNPTPPTSASTYLPNDYADDQVYDDPSRGDSSPERRRHHRHHSSKGSETYDDEATGHKRRRRRRRNSDPSSDRPNVPSKHRRRNKNLSRSPSPASSNEVEELPPRFDKHGTPLDGSRGAGGGGQGEMVEKLVHDFGDVVDGRKSWKDLLGGLMDGGGLGAALGGSGGGSGSDRESSSRRKRRG